MLLNYGVLISAMTLLHVCHVYSAEQCAGRWSKGAAIALMLIWNHRSWRRQDLLLLHCNAYYVICDLLAGDGISGLIGVA